MNKPGAPRKAYRHADLLYFGNALREALGLHPIYQDERSRSEDGRAGPPRIYMETWEDQDP